MTIVSINLFEALKKAGVPPELAEKASNEVAESNKLLLEQKTHIDKDINNLDKKFDKLDAKVTSIQEELRTKFNLMIGISLMLFGTTLATLVSIILLLIK